MNLAAGVIHAINCECNFCRSDRGDIIDEQAFLQYQAELAEFEQLYGHPLKADGEVFQAWVDLISLTRSACPEHVFDRDKFQCSRCGFFACC